MSLFLCLDECGPGRPGIAAGIVTWWQTHPSWSIVEASRKGSVVQESGPLQSNGKCLLERPAQSQLKPKPSARSAVAVPQVAICPGPTSAPGALWSCTRAPTAAVGPVRASARASTLPESPPPVGKVVSDLELDRYVLDPANLADEFPELTGPAASLSTEDDLQRVALVVVCTLVDEHPERHARLPRPDVPLERAERDNVQPVEYYVAVATLVDVPREDALAVALARSLSKRARTRNRAFADVKPVSGEPPLSVRQPRRPPSPMTPAWTIFRAEASVAATLCPSSRSVKVSGSRAHRWGVDASAHLANLEPWPYRRPAMADAGVDQGAEQSFLSRFVPGPVVLAALLLGAALVTWIVTVERMQGMDAGPGTDLGAWAGMSASG